MKYTRRVSIPQRIPDSAGARAVSLDIHKILSSLNISIFFFHAVSQPPLLIGSYRFPVVQSSSRLYLVRNRLSIENRDSDSIATSRIPDQRNGVLGELESF